MYRLIKDLQLAGDLYTIVECGTASVVSNEILSVTGASAMVNHCLQPYSKESQETFLGKEFKRSVSKEWVMDAFKVIEGPCIITQFQVQGSDVNTLTHGWIGVRGKHGTAIYHMSIYRNYGYDDIETFDIDKRAHYLQDIKETCVTIMHKHSVLDSTPLNNLFIDGVWDENGEFDFDSTIDILGLTDKTETMFVMQNGNWSRLEDFGRGQKGLIVMRGSFNPIHEGHTTMMDLSRKAFPEYNAGFMISIHNCRKPPITAAQARERMEAINELGYPVIFCSLPMFNDSSRAIYERWDFLPLIYPVGLDTINRFADDEATREEEINKSLSEFMSKEHVSMPFNAMTWKHFQSGFWKHHKFLAFKRAGLTLNDNAKVFADYIIEDKIWEDKDAISSTKIRDAKNK